MKGKVVHMRRKGGQSFEDIVNDQRRAVVEKVIADMGRDGLRWAEPYLPALSPRNPVSGTVYSGGNRMHLGFIGYERGYEDCRWATFNQISDAGWKVKKGAKSVIIEKWKQFSYYKDNEETGEKELQGRFPKLVGYWRVFNAEEIEGIPPLDSNLPRHESDRTAVIADNLIESSRCRVFESMMYLGQAAYYPTLDSIHIAPRSTFRSDESFTRVLLHEMTHSTGHPDALARDLGGSFGTASYAQEELVAELGALFCSADLGIQGAEMDGTFYDNHVSYLKSWMAALEDDPSYLFKAASKAEKADTFIMERYEEELGKNIDIDCPELEEEMSLAGESRDMQDASSAQPDLAAPAVPLPKDR